MEIKIWIDADSCPNLVKDQVLKRANKLKIPVIFTANKEMEG